MGKKYLFSPVGNTDPIKYCHDGSLMHICRHYKPDVVYLYLSREIAEIHRKDNRYVKSLELLGEFIHHKFDIRIVENDNMVDVQQYDIFYDEFRKIIREIEEEKDAEDQLLVNMASGTPAMKSALLVMATLAEYRFLPIQVSSPQKKSNLEYEERIEYSIADNFDVNFDNESDAENRCQEVKCMKLMMLLKKDIIKKHLHSYDYRAALAVGRDIRQDLTEKAYKWLEAADARSVLDWNRMNRFLPEANGVVTPVKAENRKRVLFEYALILDLKLKRGEYADFVRAITPLGVDLLELIIEQYCGIDIEQYYDKDRKWSRKKLYNTEILSIMKKTYGEFKYGPVYSSQLNLIIQEKCKDILIAQRIKELAEIENRVRNLAAHTIVAVTPEWIKERTGKNIDEIMWLLRYICEKVKINLKKENWNSYDNMNSNIISELERT